MPLLVMTIAACSDRNVAEVATGTTEDGGGSTAPADQTPSPPDLGADAMTCGTPGDAVGNAEEFLALAGCERLLGSVVLTSAASGDLAQLSSLRVIDETLANSGNEEIQALTGLESLEWVGAISLSRGGFSDISALSNLAGIGDALLVFSDARLVDIRGLEGVRTIGGNVAISINEELASLQGLDGLEWIGGDLRITGNTKLASIAALSNLRQIDGDLEIRSSEFIPESEIDALLARVQVGGTVTLDE